jgi:hypothetical protein
LFDYTSTGAITFPSGILYDNKSVFFAPSYAEALACISIWKDIPYGFLTATRDNDYNIYYAIGGDNAGLKKAEVGPIYYLPSNLYIRPCVWVKH